MLLHLLICPLFLLFVIKTQNNYHNIGQPWVAVHFNFIVKQFNNNTSQAQCRNFDPLQNWNQLNDCREIFSLS